MRSTVYAAARCARKSTSTITIAGQNVKLRVRRQALDVEDGFPLEAPPRSRTVSRATDRIERILLTAGSGFATLGAWDWCAENDVPVVATSQNGGLRWTLLPGKIGGAYLASLRRAQAVAPFTAQGLEICTWLIRRKVEGQRDVLRELAAKSRRLPEDAWSSARLRGAALAMEKVISGLERVTIIAELRHVEAEAASVYWSGLAGFPLHFTPPSYARTVPAHWRSFVGRGSPLNRGNRNAVDPANALLSYSYTLAESETRVIVHEAGLDPYLGIGLHTDHEARQSLLYDLLEPIRPVADRLVLNLLMSHAFRPGELHLLRDGRCRLDQDLCARLWPWMPEFRRALGPVMTFVLSRLRRGPRFSEHRTYRLVEVPTKGGRRPSLGQQRWAKDTVPPALRPAGVCRSCGTLLEETPDRDYCDACFPERHREVVAAFAEKGPSILARLRKERRDPTKTPQARRKHSALMVRWHAEARAWERTHPGPHDPEVFMRTILPGLAAIPLRAMMKATGLSLRSCSRIRQGKVVPHARHWKALRSLPLQ